MALGDDVFIQFINKYAEPIKKNLNLDNDLLFTLRNEHFISDDEYESWKDDPPKIRARNRSFVDHLRNQPGNYGSLEKTRLLLKILEMRNHERPTVSKIFKEWEKKLLAAQGLTPEGDETDSPRYSQLHGQLVPSCSGALAPSNKVPSMSPAPVEPPLKRTVFKEQLSEALASTTGGGPIIQNITIGDNNTTAINVISQTQNYLELAIKNNRLNWIVDGVERKAEDLGKLLNLSPAGEFPLPTKTFKKGQVLYLNWRYDTKWRLSSRFWNRTYKVLESAKVDEEKVTEVFKKLTNYEEPSDFFFKKNRTEEKLVEAISDFKKQIKPDSEYIVVIITAHGCNRSQLLTDDLKPVELFRDIVQKLDYKGFPEFAKEVPEIAKFAKEKPRLYLINACQNDHKDFYKDAIEDLKKKHQQDPSYFQSPYFVFCSTQPQEKSRGDSKQGSFFYQAICHEGEGFSQNVPISNMISKVQKKLDDIASERGLTQTTTVLYSGNFKPYEFNFTSA